MKTISKSILILVSTICAVAQTPDTTSLVRSARPLRDASDRLEQRFGKPVTYEESVLVWQDELDVIDSGASRKWNLFPKMQTLIMPPATSNLLDSVRKTIDSFHAINSGSRFDVITSRYGVHVVPRRMHNERGEVVDAHSPLDTTITVVEAERTPLEHIRALASAVTVATGSKLEISAFPGNRNGFDSAYRARTQRFTWGVTAKVARDALIDLLEGSASTLTWRLNCQSSSQAADRMCALNLSLLTVVVTGADGVPVLRALEFDRCGDCPALSNER